MNEEILLDALNEISDEHIAEAVLYEKKRKIRWGRVLPLAACLVLVAVSALTAIRHTDTPTATDASVIDTTAATTATFAPTAAAPAITAAPAAPAVGLLSDPGREAVEQHFSQIYPGRNSRQRTGF